MLHVHVDTHRLDTHARARHGQNGAPLQERDWEKENKTINQQQQQQQNPTNFISRLYEGSGLDSGLK